MSRQVREKSPVSIFLPPRAAAAAAMGAKGSTNHSAGDPSAMPKTPFDGYRPPPPTVEGPWGVSGRTLTLSAVGKPNPKP